MREFCIHTFKIKTIVRPDCVFSCTSVRLSKPFLLIEIHCHFFHWTGQWNIDFRPVHAFFCFISGHECVPENQVEKSPFSIRDNFLFRIIGVVFKGFGIRPSLNVRNNVSSGIADGKVGSLPGIEILSKDIVLIVNAINQSSWTHGSVQSELSNWQI